MKQIFLLFLFLLPVVHFSQISYYEDSLKKAERNKYIFERNGKYGILSKTGKKLTKPIYDNVSLIYDNLFIATKDTLNGVLNKEGKVIIPINYKSVDTSIGYVTDSNTFSVVDFDDQGFIYNRNGKKIFDYVLTFSSFGGIEGNQENHLAVLFLPNEKNRFRRKLFKVLDDSAWVVEIPGYENVDLTEIFMNFDWLEKNSVSAYNFTRNNKSVISFRKNHSYLGLFNVKSNKVIPAIYEGMKYDVFSKRIYLFKDGFYSFSVDTQLENPQENSDKIVKINSDNFFCLNDDNEMFIKHNGVESPFSYPKLEEYHDESRFYYNQISYKQHSFYKNLFKYYTEKDQKKYGIINLQGKVLTKADYDEINVLFYDEDADNKLVKNRKFYEDNKIDVISLARSEHSDGSKRIDVINAEGTVIATLNLPENLHIYLPGIKINNFTENGNLFMDSYSKSNQGSSVEKFYMFNYHTGKLMIETDKAPILEVSNVGYRAVFNDADKKVKNVTVFNLKAEQIGSYNLKNDWQNNNAEYDYNWTTFPYLENGKEGLKNFNSEIVINAVYDKVKIMGNGFNIVVKDDKYSVLNDKGSIFVKDQPNEIVYDLSTKCFKDKLTGKSYFCLDNDNKVRK
jgi:hypothetical protein